MGRDLASFKDVHRNDKIVVCGCGSSLNAFLSPERFVTVGVNDVGRLFQPTYLMLNNYPHQFKDDRWKYMENSRADYVFTHLWDLALPHSNVVRFRHGSNGGVDFSDANRLNHTNTSTYMALCLAIHMGSRWIGVIGIDYTPDHFFGSTGRYTGNDAATVDPQFRKLADAAAVFGVKIFNLSSGSALTAFPKMDLEDFAALPVRVDHPASKPLKIVSYAVKPDCGATYDIARCLNIRTRHFARCIWPEGNGAIFDGDIQWRTHPDAARAVLCNADVVLAHSGKTAPEHAELLRAKPVVALANDGISRMPLPIAWWERVYQPGIKSGRVTICYTPPIGLDQCSRDHRRDWRRNVHRGTLQLLEKIASEYPVELCIASHSVSGRKEAFAMKRRAHIDIDDCITGSYHLTSLEGLAAGCVVVNRVGHDPAMLDGFRRFAGGQTHSPFTYADPETLERVITALVRRGPESLAAQGRENRLWLEMNWDFSRQWSHFWMPAVDSAMRSQKPAA